MKPTVFGILGAGWRAEFYLRIAAALPHLFRVAGIYVRRPERAEELRAMGAPVYEDREAFCALPMDFAVCCVRSADMLTEARALLDCGHAVLCETPAATSEEQLAEQMSLIPEGARLQVAEQFLRQPEFAAARALVESGLLGEVHYARISAAHGYHAASIARGLLGLGTEMPDEAHCLTLPDPIRHTRGRPGDVPPTDTVSRHNLAILRFGDKTVQIDFAREQYFSPIRTGSLLLRGTHGEFFDGTLRYLDKNDRPVTLPLVRTDYGKGTNLDGFAHARILAGEHILYENPFPLARLTDEEIAMASVLSDMAVYAETGKPFYSLDEARQDCRLSFLFDK